MTRQLGYHKVDTDYLAYRRIATCTQKRNCIHIENFDKNENMVNLGHR
jgi:hypothetical protein